MSFPQNKTIPSEHVADVITAFAGHTIETGLTVDKKLKQLTKAEDLVCDGFENCRGFSEPLAYKIQEAEDTISEVISDLKEVDHIHGLTDSWNRKIIGNFHEKSFDYIEDDKNFGRLRSVGILWSANSDPCSVCEELELLVDSSDYPATWGVVERPDGSHAFVCVDCFSNIKERNPLNKELTLAETADILNINVETLIETLKGIV